MNYEYCSHSLLSHWQLFCVFLSKCQQYPASCQYTICMLNVCINSITGNRNRSLWFSIHNQLWLISIYYYLVFSNIQYISTITMFTHFVTSPYLTMWCILLLCYNAFVHINIVVGTCHQMTDMDILSRSIYQ